VKNLTRKKVNNKLVNTMTLDLGSKLLGELFLIQEFMFNYVLGVWHRNF
jgi:hypothetical protein